MFNITSSSGRTARTAVALLAAVTTSVGVAACGSDDNATSVPGTDTTVAAPSDCATGTIVGAGSTFVQTLAQQWIKDFGNACSGATINYQGVGSGAGVEQFLSGTVDFAGSDAVLKDTEEATALSKGGAVIHIPWAAGGIAVMYHLSEVPELRLAPATLAGIFAGTVTSWDDPLIAADNPDASLPGKPIQVVHRSDGSGTTKVFTSYLTEVAPDVWTAGSGKEIEWPVGQGSKGSDGVSAAVAQADGAITYAEVSYATAAGLPVALIENAAGEFVGPTPEAVSAALADAETPDDLKVKVTYTPTSPEAYPISTTTWLVAYEKFADPAKAELFKAFVSYALEGGQAAGPGLGYAPLPASLVEKSLAVLNKVA